jgi:hypothetical protein
MDPKFQAILNTLAAKTPRSHLEPYRELILEMRKRGRSYREIAQVLKKSCGIKTGASTVNDFVLAMTKSTAKGTSSTVPKLSVTKKEGKAFIGSSCTYKNCKDTEDTVSTSKALEGIQRTVKALKDQPPQTHRKKVLFEYNPDEPLRLQRNQKSKE